LKILLVDFFGVTFFWG